MTLLKTTDDLLDEYETTQSHSETFDVRAALSLPDGHKRAARFSRHKRTGELRLCYPWILSEFFTIQEQGKKQ